jgi:hypothetical protein
MRYYVDPKECHREDGPNDNDHDSSEVAYSSSSNGDRRSTRTKNDRRQRRHRSYLSAEYQLNEYDVICGRGSTCYDHIGNVRFRQLVQDHLTSYMNATTKHDKTAIIQTIIDQIRQTTPTLGGGFVKEDKSMNRYYEVGDFLAVCLSLQSCHPMLHLCVRCVLTQCFVSFCFTYLRFLLLFVLLLYFHDKYRLIERENVSGVS